MSARDRTTDSTMRFLSMRHTLSANVRIVHTILAAAMPAR
jgi:hypothetical protein